MVSVSDDASTSLGWRLRGRLPEESVLAPRGVRDGVLRSWMNECSVKDAMLVPLRSEDGLLGALAVANRLGDTNSFSTADLQVLEALANHAVVAVQNARLADRLREQVSTNRHQAMHDRLTGLPNRAWLQDRLEALLAAGSPVAVLLLDLDHFKEVNDTLGHQAGDLLLKHVASRLTGSTRDDVTVSRLGGDEFVLLMPDADPAGAVALARRA